MTSVNFEYDFYPWCRITLISYFFIFKMLTLDLEEDENRTFFYRNATESRKNITEKEPNLMKHFF